MTRPRNPYHRYRLRQAYEQGILAAQANHPPTTNPFRPGNTATAWNRGYAAVLEDLQFHDAEAIIAAQKDNP